VRRATRSIDNTTVAIKFLAPDPKYIEEAKFDDVAARFHHEGQRGAKLDHPRLVKILEYVENEGGASFEGEGPKNPFIIMEFMSGRTLESEIKATDTSKVGQLEINRERLFLAIQLVDAVKYVHSHRLVHRDIKPANIFLSGRTRHSNLPRLKLGDFGVVKWGDFHQALATGTLTTTGQQGLGTLKYMSPEQAIRPKEVTPKSDVFSLGITLYELFTGQILVSPHHVYQLMTARLSRGQTFTRFMELGHKIDGGFDHFFSQLLDCFLRGIDGRPKADDLLGCLASIISRDYDIDWRVELL
jgi:serine/threonine-protein kinase